MEKVRRYLDAYTTALKSTTVELLYVDAFAGTGYRTAKAPDPDLDLLPGFPEFDELVKGSARVAIEIGDRPFDKLIFVEKKPARFRELQLLAKDFPDDVARMEFIKKDANSTIIEICDKTNWRGTRAVMFLDPYGMQVDWNTIQAIANTKSVDMWYLVPVMALIRMTPRNGKIPVKWARRIERMTGDPAWRDIFYTDDRQTSLFHGEESRKIKSTEVDRIESYFIGRLKTCFPGVAPRPWRVNNKHTQCMYILMFAVGNARGKRIALNIANHILNMES